LQEVISEIPRFLPELALSAHKANTLRPAIVCTRLSEHPIGRPCD
jgi:hypothetical protein